MSNLIGGLLFKESSEGNLIVVQRLMEQEVVINVHEPAHFAVRKTMRQI